MVVPSTAGPRPGSLARAGAAAGDNRRQATSGRDQQTLQQIPAQAGGPRGAVSPAVPGQQCHTARRLAARPDATLPPERCTAGTGQQTGTDRLGGPAPQDSIQLSDLSGGVIPFADGV